MSRYQWILKEKEIKEIYQLSNLIKRVIKSLNKLICENSFKVYNWSRKSKNKTVKKAMEIACEMEISNQDLKYLDKQKVIYWSCLLNRKIISKLSDIEDIFDMAVIEGSMVFVQGGTFQMGSNDFEANSDEPLHSVTVDSFYIGKYEVTQREYQALMGTNPSYFKGDNLPVESVSWNDAIAYCNALSKKEGLPVAYKENDGVLLDEEGKETTDVRKVKGYRLPTEAEWEFAARGGNSSRGYKYSGSDDPGAVAWYDDNSGDETHEVGSKQANELGIHDLSGNVWEWVSDWYDESYYSNSPANNPYNSVSGFSGILSLISNRVNRGGSCYNYARDVRVASRSSLGPDYRDNDLGFRLSRTAP